MQDVDTTDVTASALAEPVDKYTCGPEFYQQSLDAITAGSVEAQGGKTDLSPLEGALRLKVSPSSQIGYQARTPILPIPDNISVYVISGFPGCGADVFAKNAAKMAHEYNVVIARIDTDKFLGDNSGPCDLCVAAQKHRSSVRPHKCRLGPASINVDYVNSTINAEVAKMQTRPNFVNGRGKGIIFIEGAYPHCDRCLR